MAAEWRELLLGRSIVSYKGPRFRKGSPPVAGRQAEFGGVSDDEHGRTLRNHESFERSLLRGTLAHTSASCYTIRPKKSHIRSHAGKCGLSQWTDHALANVA